MTKPNSFKRWIALLLSLVLVLNIYIPVTAAVKSPEGITDRVLEAIQKELEDLYNPNDEVRVSIVLEEKSTLEAGYSTVEIASNKKAMSYRENLLAKQATVQKAIERKLNKELDVVWNLTLATNLISANVKRGDIAAIKSVDGVKSVYVERQYLPDVVSVGGTKGPDMAISGEVDGAQAAWDAGYTGEGALIAIIDTGLDTAHQSFNNDAFLYAVNEDGEVDLKLTEAKVLELAEYLNATRQKNGKADSYYRNEKIPFGWNYIDRSVDITHDNDTAGEHGSHVAGIAAANRLIPDGKGGYVDALDTVQVAGNAPDAQVMVMKVFGKGGGAYDGDCAAAIEDAIFLKADAVNLSLGMAIPGFALPQGDDPYAALQKTMEDSQTVVVFSAGNAGSWADNTYMGYLYNDGVSYQFGGESGSYTNSFTVASVDNAGFIGATATANGVEFGWTDGSIGPAFRTLDTTGKGTEYKFVMVNPGAAGHDDEIAAALASEIKGAIYITWRGTSSFYEKGNAGAGAGAVGVLVANNQPGTISMDLTGYTGSVPVASTLQADGLAIWDSVSEKQTVPGTSYQYITGTITVDGTVGSHTYNTNYFNMSSFSSWGTTGDLALKPEISAFGGSIYSVWGSNKSSDAPQTAHDQYELMSGTSMAAPQITGMSALVQQYLRTKGYDLNGNTARAITQGLLMATAKPMKDADGNYYSLLQQGAGLANVNNAVSSPVYITVKGQNDGKVKAELGDDPGRSGEYVVTFTMYNWTGEAHEYALSVDAFTQAYLTEVYEIEGEYLDYATRALDYTVAFTADGKSLEGDAIGTKYDFDGNGTVDSKDAQALLDYVIKGTELAYHAENADINGDGVVDTYDVHLLLNLVQITVTVPANGSVEVTAVITLTEEEIETLNTQNPDGAYVEAFVIAEALADDEGVLAPTLNVPVLAYYGSWTDASMFEVGDGEDWYDRTNNGLVDDRYPYTYQGAYTGYNLTLTNVLYKGAPSTSMSKTNVVRNNSDAGLDMGTLNYIFTPIRNYGNGVVQITDNFGNVLWRSEDLGASYGVTYYENAGFWVRPTISGSLYYNLYDYVTVDWATAMRNAGDDVSEITVTLILAPEYYAQYGYDWDALTDGNPDNGELGEGAKLKTTLVLDQEPPVIGKITVDGTTAADRTITVELTDNKALATARLYDESNNPQNFTAAVRNTGYESKTVSGTSATVTFNGGDQGNTTGYLYDAIYRLEVTDTSGNVTTLRIPVGMDFTETPVTVTPSKTSIEIVKGATYTLTAEVGPYNLTDEAKAVTWSSADPSIATVDPETGVVTAVNKGTTTITVSTVKNGENGQPVTAEVEVKVFTLPITATGILGDADGYAKFFEWDFEEGVLSYSDAEESEVVYPQAVTPYEDGTFLAVDGDGTMYVIDADGTELKSSYGVYDGYLPYDMDYTEEAGFWWTLWGYLLNEDDPLNPEMSGFDLSRYGEFIGLAIDDDYSFTTTYQGSVVYVERTIYLLNTDNQIIEIYLYNGGQNALISTNETDLTAKWVGYGGESYSNMVLGADGNLYASIMTGDTNEVYQLTYWEDDSSGDWEWGYTSLYLGNFGDDVWPGLFLTVGNKPVDVKYDFNNDGVVDEKDAQELLRAVVRSTNTAAHAEDMDVNGDGKVTTRDVYDLLVKIGSGDLNKVKTPASAKLASIETSVRASSNRGLKALKAVVTNSTTQAEVNSTTHTVVVPIKASDVNNGLYELNYDSSVLTYSSNKTNEAIAYVYNKDTTVRVGFANVKTLAADTVVAEITFTYEAAADDRHETVTISVIEEDDTVHDVPVTEDVDVLLPGEDLVSYNLTGILTDEDFYVHSFDWNTAEGIEYTHTFGSLQNPVVVASKDDSSYYVLDYNWGTEVYDLYLVSKENGAILETHKGWGDPDDIVPWDMAYLGDDYGMWGVYGYYLITDIETKGTFDYAGAFNLSAYGYFISLTVVNEPWTAQSSSSGIQTGDSYILALSTDGNVYKFMPYKTATGVSALINYYAYTNLPDLWYDVPWATDEVPGTSLVYGEDGALYFSCIDADLEASVVYRLTFDGNKYVGEKIAETDYWVYPALLLDAGVADNTPDVPDTPDTLTFDGILSDDGDGKFFTWADAQTTITGDAEVAPIGISKTVKNDGYYVISENDGKLYRLDKEGKKVGNGTNVSEAVWDVADTRVGIFGIYGTYLIAPFQPETFALSGFDLTQFDEYIYYFSAITAAEQHWTVETTSGAVYEGDIMLYLLDDYGWVWPIYVREEGGEFAGIIVGEYSNDLYTKLRVEPEPYGGSTLIVGDENTLYASVKVGNTNNLYQIDMDHETGDCKTTELGALGYPGLITDVRVPANNGNAVRRVANNAKVLDTSAAVSINAFKNDSKSARTTLVDSVNNASIDKDAVLVSKNASKTVALKGSVNSIDPKFEDDATYPKTTITVPVYATASTNGEFILSYDVNVLELIDSTFGSMLTSYTIDEDGNIHVGYAAGTAIDEIVVSLVFEVLDPDATFTSVTLTTIQDGAVRVENPEEEEIDIDIEIDHVWGEWSVEEAPTCEEDGVETRVCENDESHVETRPIPATGHTPADAEIENVVEATCEEDGSHDEVVYCSVCDKELSRETKVDEAIGHSYGEPEFTWSEDGKSATATFTCENNSEHTETVEATVTSEVKTPATETEKGTTTYTATVEFEGETYTATKDVQDIPATGSGSVPPKTGDDSHIALFATLAMISLIGMGATIVFRRKFFGESK